MPHLITHDSYNYRFDPSSCAGCDGKCCRGESGNIFVKKDEIALIAAHLKLDTVLFMKEYLRKEGFRYSIKERLVNGSHDCIFFDLGTMRCSIYDARPNQCKSFPFWPYYQNRIDELKQECPGILND